MREWEIAVKKVFKMMKIDTDKEQLEYIFSDNHLLRAREKELVDRIKVFRGFCWSAPGKYTMQHFWEMLYDYQESLNVKKATQEHNAEMQRKLRQHFKGSGKGDQRVTAAGRPEDGNKSRAQSEDKRGRPRSKSKEKKRKNGGSVAPAERDNSVPAKGKR